MGVFGSLLYGVVDFGGIDVIRLLLCVVVVIVLDYFGCCEVRFA